MKKILVTGADGFIGSHLTESLIKDGYNVKAFVMYNSFNSHGWLDQCDSKIKNDYEAFSGDIRDPHSVKQSMTGCTHVLHLAALIGIPYSYIAPDSYIDTNVKGTLNILEAAKSLNIESLVHTSTSEVYGSAQFVPITEKHPIVGQSPYSASKIAADQLAYSYYSSFNMPVKTIRPFNTYGPRQSNRAVIPTIITQLLSGKKTIKLGSLSPKREFNFVDDTVNGFKKAIFSSKGNGETINIGNGTDFSIGDVAKMIMKIMKTKIKILEDVKRIRPKNSEVSRLKASNSKAKKLIEWSPNYHGKKGLEKGLIKTIEWFSKEDNLKKYNSDKYII